MEQEGTGGALVPPPECLYFPCPCGSRLLTPRWTLTALAENLDLWSSCTLRYAGHHLAVAELARSELADGAAPADAPSPLQLLLDAVAEPLHEGEGQVVALGLRGVAMLGMTQGVGAARLPGCLVSNRGQERARSASSKPSGPSSTPVPPPLSSPFTPAQAPHRLRSASACPPCCCSPLRPQPPQAPHGRPACCGACRQAGLMLGGWLLGGTFLRADRCAYSKLLEE